MTILNLGYEKLLVDFDKIKFLYGDGNILQITKGLNQFTSYADTLENVGTVLGTVSQLKECTHQLKKIHSVLIRTLKITHGVDFSKNPLTQVTLLDRQACVKESEKDFEGLTYLKILPTVLTKTKDAFVMEKQEITDLLTPQQELDDQERLLFKNLYTSNYPSAFEIGSREGSIVPGSGTNQGLHEALIKERKTLHKPADMDQKHYEKLLESNKHIDDILKNLNDLISRIKTHGTGLNLPLTQ